MWTFINRNWFLKTLVYLLTCLFVYGGAVNLGAFDIFAAIPFIGILFYLTFKWRRMFIFSTAAFLIGCAFLYSLKLKRHPIFFPALGKEFFLVKDLCLRSYVSSSFTEGSSEKFFIFQKDFASKNDCQDESDLEVQAYVVLKKGTRLKVQEVVVSNADLGEQYYIKTETPIGPFSFRDLDSASWLNGFKVDASDLRRNIFYVPSLLMYWPVFPIMIFTSFQRGAFAQSLTEREKAQRIIEHAVAIKVPNSSSTPFEHWFYNSAILTASHCWRRLTNGAIDPKAQIIMNAKFTQSGAWQIPKKERIDGLCDSLALKGFHSSCVSSQVQMTDVLNRPEFPLDYIQVDQTKPLTVTGVLRCYLDKDQTTTFDYPGPIEAEWAQNPSLQSFNINRQERILKAGTLFIKSKHAPDMSGQLYKEPKTAIIITP
jgi:hypothetical protein